MVSGPWCSKRRQLATLEACSTAACRSAEPGMAKGTRGMTGPMLTTGSGIMVVGISSPETAWATATGG